MRINAASVIPHRDSQMACSILDFYFDRTCLRMAKCIHQSLASNTIHLVANQRMQWLGHAFHNHAIGDLVRVSQLLWNSTECLLQASRCCVRGAKTSKCSSAFLNDLSHQLQDTI